jgi:ferredoxin/protein involved in ribonucleotide reduction
MEIQQVKLIYFSPTGTTQKILESIAQGIGIEHVEHINLTLPAEAHHAIPAFSNELVIIGAPVYGGRLPVEAIKRLQQLKANRTLAVAVVVYGNREFEDSLLELKNLAAELGFLPIAGGAFIGEHSFATKDLPIANGRPDNLDINKAMEFGAKIKEKIAALQSADQRLPLSIPGRFPYEGGVRPMTIAPLTNEDTCTVCGTCATVCPTAAIAINGRVTTTIDRCIRCSACIKSCPTDSRYWDDDMMKKITTWLNENCAQRKEPQTFLADI